MRLLDNAVARHYLHYELFLLLMRLSNSEKVSLKKSRMLGILTSSMVENRPYV